MKCFFNLFLSMGLAAACFLGGCKESGYSKHKVGNTEPILTNVFLDEPDSMVYMYDGREKALADGQRTEIYEKFCDLMESFGGTDTLKNPFSASKADDFRDQYGGVEFRYNRRRNFVGSLAPYGGTDYFTWGELIFDAFLIVPYSSELMAIPYLDGEYIGINNLFLGLTFPQEVYGEFAAAIEGLKV